MATPSELDLARLIVDTLGLDLKPEQIGPKDALFGDGLKLDSIDGLEVAMAIKKAYGVLVDNNDAKQAFASLEALRIYLESRIQTAVQ